MAHHGGREAAENCCNRIRRLNPEDKPSYETKPVAPNSQRQEMYRIAFTASQLVVALTCREFYAVHEENITAEHKKLMKDGERFGEAFVDSLSDELNKRRIEARRDGRKLHCEEQRQWFAQNGVTGIYRE